ncbi:uncharacterized protein LOC143423644 [Xylocopa sonorina]|uniref:uncharacterized protein LOC143423644 n=1 Tax=Xylocopa sonorina TaxID=1818115 RepID=UPI00403AF3E6
MFFHPQRLVCYRSSTMKKAWSISSQKLIINPASLEEGLARKEEEPCEKAATNPSNSWKPSSRGLKLILIVNLLVCVTCTYYIITQAYLTKSEEIKLTNMLGELRSEISNVINEIDSIIEEEPAKTEDALKRSALQTTPREEILERRNNVKNNKIDLPVDIISSVTEKFVSENGLSTIEEHESEVTIGNEDETTTFTPDASDSQEKRLYEDMELISGLEPPLAQHFMIQWPVESPKIRETETSIEVMKTDDDNIEHYGLFWLLLQNAASHVPSVANCTTDKQTRDSDGSSTERGDESLEDERQDRTTPEQSVDDHVDDKNETDDTVNIQEENATTETTTAFHEDWVLNSDEDLSSFADAAYIALVLRNYRSQFDPIPFVPASGEFGMSDYSSIFDDWAYPSDYALRDQHKRSADNPPPTTNGNDGRKLPPGVVVVPLTKDKGYRRPGF